VEREGAAVTCDGRLFHTRAAAAGNDLSPTVDSWVGLIIVDSMTFFSSPPAKHCNGHGQHIHLSVHASVYHTLVLCHNDAS